MQHRDTEIPTTAICSIIIFHNPFSFLIVWEEEMAQREEEESLGGGEKPPIFILLYSSLTARAPFALFPSVSYTSYCPQLRSARVPGSKQMGAQSVPSFSSGNHLCSVFSAPHFTLSWAQFEGRNSVLRQQRLPSSAVDLHVRIRGFSPTGQLSSMRRVMIQQNKTIPVQVEWCRV